MANVLLLSMSMYNRELSEHYYRADKGEVFFRGVSQLEAGTKYFLRTLQWCGKKLDKIIVIESQEVRHETKEVSDWLRGCHIDGTMEMTATEFYRERITQYIEGKEKCVKLDSALEPKAVAYEERVAAAEKIDKVSLSELYSNPEELFESVEMGVGDSAVYECIKTASERIKELARMDGGVNLYLDMQGARRYETFVINTVVKMLEVCDVWVKESVAVDFKVENTKNEMANQIVVTTDNNIILEMVSGMNEFIKTGRGDTLQGFWKKYKKIPGIKKDGGVNEIIEKIKQTSDAISLCSVEDFDKNLVGLKQTIEDYEKRNESEKQPLFQTFVADLKEDYFGTKHDLLPDDKRMKIINQINWCVDKKLYQQALALVEDKIPENLVNSRILYYGDEKQLKQLINGMLNKGWTCPSYLLGGKEKNKVKEGKEAFVWVKYVMEYRKGNSGRFLGVTKAAELSMSEITSTSNATIPEKVAKIGDLLMRYYELNDQRNKVMHATDKNCKASEIRKLLKEFIKKYKELLRDGVSCNYSLVRPLIDTGKAEE